MHKKILFAAGGTGGHLLPAQALAKRLKEQNPKVEVLFAGADLGANAYFEREEFSFEEIKSASPYRDSLIKASVEISKGFFASLRLLKKHSPDLVVGFGSFHSFPLLLGARWKQVPYILVETNAYPGKVNRVFSKRAKLSVLQFREAGKVLKGLVQTVKMPIWSKPLITKEEARKHYSLDPEAFTLLVFGGSGGARAINEAVLDLHEQVIHFCGRDEDPTELEKKYSSRGVRAYVRPFEKNMHLAYSACDLCICRSGASTIAELIEYKIPAIFIPWGEASDDHQTKNARVLAEKKSGMLLEEREIKFLAEKVKEAKIHLEAMKKNLEKMSKAEKELSEVILEL